jgi:universal stress protein F
LVMPRKILVPIDLREESTWEKTIPEAFRLAQANGDEVVIMTVVPELTALLDWRYAIRGELGGSQDLDTKRSVAEACQRLQEIGDEHAPAGTDFEVIARAGTVYEEILNIAEELGVDQIIMAAHRPQLADYLIGPNTARVVRHAKCSVTVVRG